MIVLDEQLTGRGLERAIARWYRGTVCYIDELRPGSVIKDDAIATLLCQQRSPTFVTINEQDFWKRGAIDRRFCVVCFAISDSQIAMLNPAFRSLLRHPRFRAKADRMGCVIRVSGAGITYYRHDDDTVRLLD
jgi:hypothetical protein